MGGEKTVLFLPLITETPNPDVASALASPLPTWHPKKCPAHAQCQCSYLHRALRWGRGGSPKSAKLQLPEPSWPQEGRDFLVQPHLSRVSLHSWVSPALPRPPGERLPASTHPAITLTKGVSGCTLFSEPKPLTPSPGFSLPKERGQCLPGAFPGLPSLPHLPPPLSNRTLCGGGDVLCLRCPALAPDDY